MDQKENFELIANYVASGNAVIVLGPDFCSGSISISGEVVPSFFAFVDECCQHFDLDPTDFSSEQGIVDYLTRNREKEQSVREYMRKRFGVKRPSEAIPILPQFVWRRVYSFDLTDGVELSYHRQVNRKQSLRVVEPDDPISRARAASSTLELVKLNGDGLSESSHNVFTKPGYRKSVDTSKWYRALKLDCELHPVIILGTKNDRNFLFDEIRALRRTEAQQRLTFVCADLKKHQIERLFEQSGIHLPIDGYVFLKALLSAFPNGRSLDDISQITAGFTLKNKQLQDVIADSFTVLTSKMFETLNDSAELEGGIYSFYRGAHVRWGDVIQGIYADLTPFKNWRNRISLKLDQGFPGGHAFLLESPAGMGKTVGLMAAAYWLRQRTDRPILWLEPDGDLRGFLMRLSDDDFPRGVFVFIDDVTQFGESFEGIDAAKLSGVCFVCASRETRWRKYKRRFPDSISITSETLRDLNHADAEEIHSKIARYGTTVHFRSQNHDGQIKEILQRSERDMLVLVRELGQGRKFDEIVKSEFADLDQAQRFAYLTICITDRNQVPLPIDLFGHALQHKLETSDINRTLDGLGRIIEVSGRRRVLRTRHSIIAQHIIEPRNSVVPRTEIEDVVRSLLFAFSNYQIPIIVHHSNTGHARVFKTIINRRFLSEVLGIDNALRIYRDYEKIFERDGFFWQQYGLCQSQSGNFEAAIDTLRHAYAIHQHFLIKHSLGAASLQACAKLGPSGLKDNDFASLRAEGRELLEGLHKETGYRDDLSIATLAEIDMIISKDYDSADEFRVLGERYHRELAFYIRDHAGMTEARRVYEKLNDLLLKASSIKEPNYDEILEFSEGEF